MLRKLIVPILSFFLCQFVYANGVSLGATRLIYPRDANQSTLKIYNSDTNRNFLVQSWVADKDGVKTTDFIVTPPLFVIKANTDNILRIVYSGDKANLPNDRESLFYFYSKTIPSTGGMDKNTNALLISTTAKIKLFIRPNQLNDDDAMSSYEKLKCSYQDNQIKIENPTPFYVNLVDLKVNGKDVSTAAMIPPMDSMLIKTKEKGNSLVFNMITDYGSQLKNKACNL